MSSLAFYRNQLTLPLFIDKVSFKGDIYLRPDDIMLLSEPKLKNNYWEKCHGSKKTCKAVLTAALILN